MNRMSFSGTRSMSPASIPSLYGILVRSVERSSVTRIASLGKRQGWSSLLRKCVVSLIKDAVLWTTG